MLNSKLNSTKNSGLLILISVLYLAVFQFGNVSYGQTCDDVLNPDGTTFTPISFADGTPTLEQGTALQPGAVYRFDDVTTGVDALVEIVSFNDGGSITDIDNNNGLGTGTEPFQPVFDPETDNPDSSVDFLITFVTADTSTPVAISGSVIATGIDIDDGIGGAGNFEYQELAGADSYTVETINDLELFPPRAQSATSDGHPPSSLANRFTAVYTNISQFGYRIGFVASSDDDSTTTYILDMFNCTDYTDPNNVDPNACSFGPGEPEMAIETPIFRAPEGLNGADTTSNDGGPGPLVGDIFRFTNVTNLNDPANGIDALVEVLSETGGDLVSIDGNEIGAQNNLQPEFSPTAAEAFAELRISFVAPGETNPANTINFPGTFLATAQDVDGDEGDAPFDPDGLKELVELRGANVLTFETPTNLVANPPRFNAQDDQNFPAISTTATTNMVTGTYTNVASFTYAFGALDAGGNDDARLNSLTFRCQMYQNPQNVNAPNIGASKTVFDGPTTNGNGDVEVTYELTVENLSVQDLHDVRLSDDLLTFGTFVSPGPPDADQYTVNTPTIVAQSNTSGTFAINTGFNGSSDTEILNASTGSGSLDGGTADGMGSVTGGGSITIRFTVTFDTNDFNQTFLNQAITNADTNNDGTTDFDEGIFDLSDNGTDPDPDGDGNGNESSATEGPEALDNQNLDNDRNVNSGIVTLLSIDGNDVDTDGTVDVSTIDLDPNTPGQQTTFNVAGEGSWAVNTTTGDVTFTPLGGFTGNPTPIFYNVKDDDGNISNQAMLTVTYIGNPVAVDDESLNNPAGNVTVDIDNNDIASDDPLDLTSVDLDPETAGQQTSLNVPGEGTWTSNGDGTVTFAPEGGFTGNPTPIQYTINDTNGDRSNPATITITYVAAPTALDNRRLNQPFGQDASRDILTNDREADSALDPDTVDLIPPAGFTINNQMTDADGDLISFEVAGQGTWTYDPSNGILTFSPFVGFTDDPTPINYTVRDQEGDRSNVAMMTVTYGGDAGNCPSMDPTDECENDPTPINLSTVSVTLASFETSLVEGGVRFDWTTATEEQNIGFNLYGYRGGQKVKLNENIIFTKNGDAREPQYYDHIVDVPEDIEKVGISSVDCFGFEEHYGPYEIGATFGDLVEGEPVDWEQIKEEHDTNMIEMGYEKKGKAWRKTQVEQGLLSRVANSVMTALRLDGDNICHVEVSAEGIHRVTYEELASAGCDFNRERAGDISVSYKGEPVARRIERGFRFDTRSYIDFYGELPKGKEALFINKRVYQIQLDKSLVKNRQLIRRRGGRAADTLSYAKELKQANQIFYTESSATGDPFYETFLFTQNSPNSYSVDFNVADNLSGQGKVRVVLGGFVQLPGAQNDHHIRVHLNEVEIADVEADGFVKIEIESDVDNIVNGTNTVRIELVGDTGLVFDAVIVESTELHYESPLLTETNSLLYTSSGNRHEVGGFTERDIEVYGYDGEDLYQIESQRRRRGRVYRVIFNGTGTESDYWASSESQLLSGNVYKFEAAADDLLGGSGELLVIAHPSLMGADLNGYISSKQSEGYTVKLANILDVYEEYGYGMALPEAIRDYVAEADAALNTNTVVLVGGGSYDHRNFTNSGITDFIPTMYRLTNDTIFYSPCDGCLVDTQLGDDVADLALGRFPARTQQELSAMLNKAQIALGDSSLLVAGENDGRLDFAQQMESVGSHLPTGNVQKIYVDDFASVADARNQMFAEINNGVGLWLYSGHAGSLAWRDNLLRWDTAGSELTNSAAPAGMMPLTCYTTYYLSPNIMTLAHQLMNNASGAKFISGAGVLSNFSENEEFTVSILDKMNEGKTIGQAILETKQENKGLSDQVVNWILLGDPTEKF